MHLTVQQLKDHLVGLALIGFGLYFGGWIWGNFPTRGGRAMAGTVILGSLMLLLTILYYDLMHR